MIRLLPILLSIFLIGGCSSAPEGGWIDDQSSTSILTWGPAAGAGATDGPDRKKTPGAYWSNVTVDDIAVPGYTSRVRNVPQSVKKKIFEQYSIPWEDRPEYEIDHLIPLTLGGSNDITNLWPQPYSGQYGARLKDKLENKLHDLVVSGDLDLREAQREIAMDWVKCYKKHLAPQPEANR